MRLKLWFQLLSQLLRTNYSPEMSGRQRLSRREAAMYAYIYRKIRMENHTNELYKCIKAWEQNLVIIAFVTRMSLSSRFLYCLLSQTGSSSWIDTVIAKMLCAKQSQAKLTSEKSNRVNRANLDQTETSGMVMLLLELYFVERGIDLIILAHANTSKTWQHKFV